MNKLDDAVEEIKRVLIGNKSKDVNDVYLGNAIRFIEEYQKDAGDSQPKQEGQQKARKVLSTVVASEYFSDFKKELDWALEGIAPENLVDVKYQVCRGASRNEHSAIVIYKK